MSTNPRRQKNLKRKFAAYILLLGVLGTVVFFLNALLISRRPLFISPLGKINTDISFVEKNLKDKQILFSEVSAQDNTYLVNISNNRQVRFSADKDINQQVSSLQKILIQLTIEGKSFKNIDFRFEEPIISF
ncbi:MAG: hypothetical protein HW400_544 [Candidatus Levybacteria bacterium]|nr:hypothetical protein [Candidatus Levybacteria bacterium]